jgi:hypothetical protein
VLEKDPLKKIVDEGTIKSFTDIQLFEGIEYSLSPI